MTLLDRSDPELDALERVRPELVTAANAHYDDLAAIVGPELLGACRQRVRAVLAGETAFPDPADDAERACLAYAEQFVHSAQWVTDEHVDALRRHLTAEQVFALTVGISLAERMDRLTGLLAGLQED